MAELIDFSQTSGGQQAYQKMIEDKQTAEKRYAEKKAIYEKRQKIIKCFGHGLSETIKQKCLDKGKLCILCDGLFGTYEDSVIVENQPYCDAHGRLMLKKHREMHPESEDLCVDCAVLDCPFGSEDHYERTGDAEGCPECSDPRCESCKGSDAYFSRMTRAKTRFSMCQNKKKIFNLFSHLL